MTRSAAACTLLAFCAAAATAQIPYERIASADREPQSWMTYSRDYTGQRYSPLAEVNAGNVPEPQDAVGLPDARSEQRDLAARGRRHHVSHGAELRDRARRAHGPRALDVEAPHTARLSPDAIRRAQSRRRRSWAACSTSARWTATSSPSTSRAAPSGGPRRSSTTPKATA